MRRADSRRSIRRCRHARETAALSPLIDHRAMSRDERWGSYPETVLRFAGDPELIVDLREEVSDATRSELIRMGLGLPFGILTAFNPRGLGLSPAMNAQRMKDLESEIESAGHAFVRVDACSPDLSHCESSVALKAPLQWSLDLAKKWEQLAIFWWDGDRFWLYGAELEIDPLNLPL